MPCRCQESGTLEAIGDPEADSSITAGDVALCNAVRWWIGRRWSEVLRAVLDLDEPTTFESLLMHTNSS